MTNQRPALVHQRSVEAVVGLPRRRYLSMARARAFPSKRVGRLVVARTADVLAYVEAGMAPPLALAPHAPKDWEAEVLARARKTGR